MVFDPPERREALQNIIKLDIDIEGDHPVQGLLLAAWISNRLEWSLESVTKKEGNTIHAKFRRNDGNIVDVYLMPLPVGNPSIHPGQIVGMRLISQSTRNTPKPMCVILASESGECMRLEAGGMASMELHEEVVPTQINSVEMDVARLLSSSRGTTSPLLAAAAPIAAKMIK